MPVLDVKNVSKRFVEDGNEVVALEGVNFAVNDDEFICLVGPSGCGKSTMLRIISGLETPTGGESSSRVNPLRVRRPRYPWSSSFSASCRGRLPKKTWRSP